MRSAFALRIISGRIIFNRAMPERLRTLRHCIFTGGVVMVNGICSAAFCESAALRLAPSPSQSPAVTSSPGAGEVFHQRESPWHSGKVSCQAVKLAGVPAPPRGPTSPGRGKMSPQVTKGGICRAATEGL